MRNGIWRLILGASAMIIFPALGFAQFGSVAGVVKDSTGAVIPNATVEAVNPASIGGARTAVSDSAGQYRIEQLSPGTYTVTIKASGFSTVRAGRRRNYRGIHGSGQRFLNRRSRAGYDYYF